MRIIQGGSHEFNALVYGQQSPATLSYLRNQVTDYAQSVMAGMSEIGKSFMSGVGQMFEHFNGSEAMRRARAAYRKVENLFAIDVIRGLKDIADMQQAMPQIQRIVMAEPTVRQAYLEQRIDGYSGQYLNVYGNDIGESHYDYRRVMDGILHEDKEGFDKFVTYFDDRSEDFEMTIEDRADALSIWAMAKAYMEIGTEDPTSAWGALM